MLPKLFFLTSIVVILRGESRKYREAFQYLNLSPKHNFFMHLEKKQPKVYLLYLHYMYNIQKYIFGGYLLSKMLFKIDYFNCGTATKCLS